MAGETGLDFTSAVTFAAFREATAIEATAGGYSEVLKARQVKINDLAEVLSLFSKAVANLKVKGGKSTDKVTVDNRPEVVQHRARRQREQHVGRGGEACGPDWRRTGAGMAVARQQGGRSAGAADTRRGVEYGKGTSKKENLGDAPVDVLTTLNDEAKKSAEDFYDDIKSGKGSGRNCSNACCQNAIKKK